MLLLPLILLPAPSELPTPLPGIRFQDNRGSGLLREPAVGHIRLEMQRKEQFETAPV